MESIMSNTVAYDKCDIIGTLENQALTHMGVQRWEAFKNNVEIPREEMDDDHRNRVMRDFVRAMEKECGIEQAKKIFSGVCHGLKPSDLPWAREQFLLYNDIDKFCEAMLKENTELFTKACEIGEWVHGQIIDKEVLEYLLQFPELLYGKRDGSSIIATAIPYNTRAYLSE